MSKAVKITLVVLAAIVLLGLGTCGAGYFWIKSNKDELLAEGKRLTEEATHYAESTDQEGCVKEALRRSNACGATDLLNIVCLTKAAIFMDQCIRSATPTPGFCDGVPLESDIFGTVTWSTKRCTDLEGQATQRCNQLVSKIGRYCAKPRAP